MQIFKALGPLLFITCLLAWTACTEQEPQHQESNSRIPEQSESHAPQQMRSISDSTIEDSLRSSPIDSRPYYYKRLVGSLGENLFVSFHLVRDNDKLNASYLYEHIGQPIPLIISEEITDSQQVALRELDMEMPLSEESRGQFEGPFFSKNRLSGQWFASDREVHYPFVLEQAYGAGSVPIHIKHFDMTRGDCESNQCMNISYSYPYIDSSVHHNLARNVNEAVEIAMIDALSGEIGSGLSLEDAAQLSLQEYMDLKKDADPSSAAWFWQQELTVKILCNDSYMLSLALDFYSYSGGAHGNPYSLYLNFDTRTGEPISLATYLRPGFESALTTAVRDRIKLIYGGNSKQDLSSMGFLVPDEEFALSENYFLSPAGMGFVYNPYELGPYAMGYIEVFYPFQDIPGWVKTGN